MTTPIATTRDIPSTTLDCTTPRSAMIGARPSATRRAGAPKNQSSAALIGCFADPVGGAGSFNARVASGLTGR